MMSPTASIHEIPTSRYRRCGRCVAHRRTRCGQALSSSRASRWNERRWPMRVLVRRSFLSKSAAENELPHLPKRIRLPAIARRCSVRLSPKLRNASSILFSMLSVSSMLSSIAKLQNHSGFPFRFTAPGPRHRTPSLSPAHELANIRALRSSSSCRSIHV